MALDFITRVESQALYIDVTSVTYGAIASPSDQVFDGAMANGSDLLDCATSQPFTAEMVGWHIDVLEAGASAVDYHGVTGYNNRSGTILAYVDPTRVQVSFTASHAITAQQVTYGPDSTAAIQAATAAAHAIGASVYFPRGFYVYRDSITCQSGMTYFGDGKGQSVIRQIGPTRDVSPPFWPASTAVVAGVDYVPTDFSPARKYRVTVAGTTGASEPAWSSTLGATVTSGGVTFTDVGPARYHAFKIDNGTHHVTVRDLSVYGTNNSKGTALGIVNGPLFAFSTAVLWGTGGATGGDAGNPDRIADITITNCELSYLWGLGQRNDGDVGDQNSANPGIWRMKILHCDMINNADNGLNPHVGGGLEVAYCFFSGNGTGIETAGSKTDFHNNILYKNRIGGVSIGGLGNPSEGKDNFYAFNIVVGNGNGIGTGASGHGFQIDGNNVHAEICHNIIRENYYQGIGIGGAQPHFSDMMRDLYLHHNHVVSNGSTAGSGYFGIACGTAGVRLEDNIVFNDPLVTGYDQRLGIFISNGTPNCSVLRNHVYGHAFRDYHLGGINMTFVDEHPDSVIYYGGPGDPALSGTVDTAGNVATWKTGDLFSEYMKTGSPVRINGVDYAVGAYQSPPLGTCDQSIASTTITRVTGPNFEAAWIGKWIRTGGTGQVVRNYLITAVPDASHITIDPIYGNPPTYTGTHWELHGDRVGTGSVTLNLHGSAGTQSNVAYTFSPSFVFPYPGQGGELEILVYDRIVPTHKVHTLDVGNVQYIGIPPGFKDGMSFTILPLGAFTLTAINNIAVASTAIPNKPMVLTLYGGFWYPSY